MIDFNIKKVLCFAAAAQSERNAQMREIRYLLSGTVILNPDYEKNIIYVNDLDAYRFETNEKYAEACIQSIFRKTQNLFLFL